jgi:N-Acetylglucosaminyltransferase-IV (GnT-IV) conserved region
MTPPGRQLVVGIPTVARKRGYVARTVDLLLSRAGTESLDRVRFVVMNAQVPPEAHEGVDAIRERHRSAIARGVLQVIEAPLHPPESAQQSRALPAETSWKRKQVLDAAAIMELCAPAGSYYLHLEDDVEPAMGYLSEIMDFIEEEERTGGWHALAFYTASPARHRGPVDPSRFWGFIGVLFRTSELPDLIAEFRRRRLEAPVDTLLTDYLAARELELRAHVPSLFEHVGFHSSLPSRVQSFRAWRWAGDRTPIHRFFRRCKRSLHVRWLWWRMGR